MTTLQAITLTMLCIVSELGAQEIIDLGSIRECSRCELRPRLMLSMGEAEGPGIIEANHAQVRQHRDGGYAIFHVGGTRILWFDSKGRFVRAIGQKGSGPGEFERLTDVQLFGSTVYALEAGERQITVMNQLGHLKKESRLALRGGRFRVVDDSAIVVAAMDRTPAAVGYPLHLVDVSTGIPARHFGSTDGQWTLAQPYSEVVILGSSPSRGTLWRGYADQFVFEEWGLDGGLRRRVNGNAHWLAYSAGTGRDTPPQPLIDKFGIDAQERLWTITRIPDAEWQRARRQGSEGYVLTGDQDAFYDTRVDVIDLRTRRHLGTLRWDESHAAVVQLGGSIALAKVIYTDEGVPRVAIFQLEPTSR